MVRGLFQRAHMFVDGEAGQSIRCLWRQQQMVDAQAVVPLPGAARVVPERVNLWRVGRGAQRIRQAEVLQRAEFLTRFRAEESVADPGFGM